MAVPVRQSQETGQRGQCPAPAPAVTWPCGPRGGQREVPRFLLGLLVWVLGPHLPKPRRTVSAGARGLHSGARATLPFWERGPT